MNFEMRNRYDGHGDLAAETEKATPDAALPAPSPLPWRLCGQYPDTVLSGKDHESVADCGRQDEALGKANAEFIVRACNSHHALVRAAKTALQAVMGRPALVLLIAEALAAAGAMDR